jgi:uncharacterized membrane protein YhhN
MTGYRSITFSSISVSTFPLPTQVPKRGKRKDVLVKGLTQPPLPLTVAISCAITIPLLVVAFNLTRIAGWWNQAKAALGRKFDEVPVAMWAGGIALVAGGAVIGAVWSAPLAVGVKAAVTACIAVLVVMALAALGSYAMSTSVWRARGLMGSAGSVTSSSFETLGD